ncbi:MAG: hypothetical protein PHO83_03695 [Geobacteraceae bacterium]|nr:hypothetical protein [Geobacteraceae bacterium]
MINYDLVIDKIKSLKNLRHDSQVAEMFNISPPDFSARKKKGTLLPLVIEWAINENVNIDFLLRDGDNLQYFEVKNSETKAGVVAEEQLDRYKKKLPEPIEKAVNAMLENQDKAWEFYAMILERIEKAKKSGDK